MNKEQEKYLKQWIAKANEDLRAAEQLFADSPLSVIGVIGFHCQQCIEKYLKIFLIYNNFDFPLTHDLDKLKDMCVKFDSSFSAFDFISLTDYAVDFRYPDGEYKPNLEEARRYLILARKVKTFIRKKINLKKLKA